MRSTSGFRQRLPLEIDAGLGHLEIGGIERKALADLGDDGADRLGGRAAELRHAESTVAELRRGFGDDGVLAELGTDLGEQGARAVGAEQAIELGLPADLHEGQPRGLPGFAAARKALAVVCANSTASTRPVARSRRSGLAESEAGTLRRAIARKYCVCCGFNDW